MTSIPDFLHLNTTLRPGTATIMEVNQERCAGMINRKFDTKAIDVCSLEQSLTSKSVPLNENHQNIINALRNHSTSVQAPKKGSNLLIENDINPGYITDDEASDDEQPVDSGRTRSSTRKSQMPDKETSKDSTQSGGPKRGESSAGGQRGRKRKQVNSNGDGSDSDKDEKSNKKTCVDVEPEITNFPEETVCSCPKDVMKCIGILPSLPIISCLYDSDDSLSTSNDDLTYTVLPTVSRDHGGNKEC